MVLTVKQHIRYAKYKKLIERPNREPKVTYVRCRVLGLFQVGDAPMFIVEHEDGSVARVNTYDIKFEREDECF